MEDFFGQTFFTNTGSNPKLSELIFVTQREPNKSKKIRNLSN